MPEGALTETRLHGLRCAVAAELVNERLCLTPETRRALQALSEGALPVVVQDVDGLVALDARVPVGVVGDPVVAGEEHRLEDHDADDFVVLGTGEEGASVRRRIASMRAVISAELSVPFRSPSRGPRPHARLRPDRHFAR